MSNTLPRIVLLEITSRSDHAANRYAAIRGQYSGQADVQLISAPEGASAFFQLDGPQRPVVLVSDSFLQSPYLDILVPQAAEFVRKGGSFVFPEPPRDGPARIRYKTLFQAFSLPWQFGEYSRTECVLNPDCNTIRKDNLSRGYNMKSVKLRDVKRRDKVYVPSTEAVQPRVVHGPGGTYNLAADPDEVPVAMAEVGAGKVGYIGDINALSEAVLRAMLGL
ncbi:hypothetical protein AC579_1153 [Pseudocercospora musae]|uniref:Uncharacterized protein n=1 Tax=Pseudocercospora musae TaxID=113226 RepID=A0A139I2Z1_9PEZI|nr:hypothetical protein AC579_1153 [Pseudocercospora musae]